TVPCTTYLVQPGYFDIFFPTDFSTLAEMYALVMSQQPRADGAGLGYFSRAQPTAVGAGAGAGSNGSSVAGPGVDERPRRALEVLDHAEFLERWAETDMTRVGDGTNPMVDSYQNAKFIC
ncbi:hypothetical protein JCM8202_005843, partial [Rhodotorula sphaerocarpa]